MPWKKHRSYKSAVFQLHISHQASIPLATNTRCSMITRSVWSKTFSRFFFCMFGCSARFHFSMEMAFFCVVQILIRTKCLRFYVVLCAPPLFGKVTLSELRWIMLRESCIQINPHPNRKRRKLFPHINVWLYFSINFYLFSKYFTLAVSMHVCSAFVCAAVAAAKAHEHGEV